MDASHPGMYEETWSQNPPRTEGAELSRNNNIITCLAQDRPNMAQDGPTSAKIGWGRWPQVVFRRYLSEGNCL